MVLRSLRLVNFRRYIDSFYEFNDKTNFINGDNGSGKTSILEAIHYLSLTKSFRTNNDIESINYQSDYFNIFGEFITRNLRKILFNMNYTKTEGRGFLLDKNRIKRYTDIVGYAPVVVLSPALQKITDGGPSERRNFINRIISQVDRGYLLGLLEYKKRLSQRNTVLNQYRDRNQSVYDTYFEAQDEILVEVGRRLFQGQQSFINSFCPVFQEIFSRINHSEAQVHIGIKSNIKSGSDNYSEVFLKHLKERFTRDLQAGRTGCGPHLDDVIIHFNGKEIRQIGSQGEHKLVLVALKLAEGHYIESHKNEPIIFLLDDLFAFLDNEHCRKIVEEITGKNQTFITSTDIKELERYGFRERLPDLKVIHLTAGVA